MELGRGIHTVDSTVSTTTATSLILIWVAAVVHGNLLARHPPWPHSHRGQPQDFRNPQSLATWNLGTILSEFCIDGVGFYLLVLFHLFSTVHQFQISNLSLSIGFFA